MTPTSLYYIGLYILVFVIRFFKLYKEYSNHKKETEKFKWKSVCFVSLEIVYTSAGFIIVLLENSKNWIPAIVIFYIILVLISTNLDSLDDKFNEKTKFIVHLIIILLIVIATSYSFSTFLSPLKNDKEIVLKNDSIAIYKIAIPYSDITLIQHLGLNKLNFRKIQVVYKIRSTSTMHAIDSAISTFWNDTTLVPLFENKKLNKKEVFIIDETNIIIQKLN